MPDYEAYQNQVRYLLAPPFMSGTTVLISMATCSLLTRVTCDTPVGLPLRRIETNAFWGFQTLANGAIPGTITNIGRES